MVLGRPRRPRWPSCSPRSSRGNGGFQEVPTSDGARPVRRQQRLLGDDQRQGTDARPRAEEGRSRAARKITASYPLGASDDIFALVSRHRRRNDSDGVNFDTNVTQDSLLVSLLVSFLPFLILLLLLFWLFNSMQGGGRGVMQFGKSKAKQVTKDTPKTTFADVAGADEAVEELQEIKDFLQNPVKFQAVGAKIPKGVLLFGPPGTGKTLLARAVAGEAGVPFFSISGSDFVEMFVGVGASRVRDLFEQAKQNAPAIIFVDEIDAVGRHRGAGMGGGHDEREQTLNQMLVEMDGFDVKGGVIMIAATNRPDILDPALLRPGRFDRQIAVDRPDLLGRKAILAVHAKGKPLAPDVDLETVARRTPGFTGADLANVLNEAALLTARNNGSLITDATLEEAIDRVIAGPERKTRAMSEKEKKVTAYHEGGHALVAHALPNLDPVHKVTILPRGRSLGHTLVLPTEDKYTQTRSEMIDTLAYALGGRAAEELVFHEPTTGAGNDIEKATSMARAMVTQYGMSAKLGAVKYGSDGRRAVPGPRHGLPAGLLRGGRRRHRRRDPGADRGRARRGLGDPGRVPAGPRPARARADGEGDPLQGGHGAHLRAGRQAAVAGALQRLRQADAVRPAPGPDPGRAGRPERERPRSTTEHEPGRRRRSPRPAMIADGTGRADPAGRSAASTRRAPRRRSASCCSRWGRTPTGPGLQDTPARVARAYAETFAGLGQDPVRDPRDHVRREPRRARAGQGHPDVLDLRAPPGAVPRRRAHRLHPRRGRPGHRAVEAGPAGRRLRPPAAGAGADDQPDRRRARRRAQAARRAGGHRGRAPLHGDARHPQARVPPP